MGTMIRSFFPELHLALLRLIEYVVVADHEHMSRRKQVLIFACEGYCHNNTGSM